MSIVCRITRCKVEISDALWMPEQMGSCDKTVFLVHWNVQSVLQFWYTWLWHMLSSIHASSSDQQQTSGNTLRKYYRITELTLSDTHSAQSIGHVSFTAFQVELNMSALCLTLATGTGSYHVHPLSKYARNCCILWPNFPLFHTHLHPSDSLDSWLWQRGRAGERSFHCEY